jgi:dye decolorizing peroxidase
VIIDSSATSRRAFIGAAGVALGTAAACAAGGDPAGRTPVGQSRADGLRVEATGAHQAGVRLPNPPQPQLLLAVFDVRTDRPAALLAELGHLVAAVTAGPTTELAGLTPGDLTCTVGVGPRLVATVDPRLPGALELPEYRREAVEPSARGGDLMVQICASDPLLPGLVLSALTTLAGPRLVPRWRQEAVRGPQVRVGDTVTASRNVLGFVDGIVVPHTEAEFDRSVWLQGPRPVAAGTIAVVRRMRLDLPGFLALPLAGQEAVFGRTRDSSIPLSGGAAGADVDLGAKSADGRYLIPADSHVRRAHPGVAGVPTMARRSYSIAGPEPGLLFISFQNALRTFTATMARMDGADALLEFTTTTASATFLVLPGFDADRALGSTLFGIR